MATTRVQINIAFQGTVFSAEFDNATIVIDPTKDVLFRDSPLDAPFDPAEKCVQAIVKKEGGLHFGFVKQTIVSVSTDGSGCVVDFFVDVADGATDLQCRIKKPDGTLTITTSRNGATGDNRVLGPSQNNIDNGIPVQMGF